MAETEKIIAVCTTFWYCIKDQINETFMCIMENGGETIGLTVTL